MLVVSTGSGRGVPSVHHRLFFRALKRMPFPSQDEDRTSMIHTYSKAIQVDTVVWVKQRMRLLEVQEQFANRVALFEEFYLPTDLGKHLRS